MTLVNAYNFAREPVERGYVLASIACYDTDEERNAIEYLVGLLSRFYPELHVVNENARPAGEYWWSKTGTREVE